MDVKMRYSATIALLTACALCVLTVGLSAVDASAQTGSVELKWDHVTKYTNGADLSPETLAARRYVIYYGSASRGAVTTAPAGYPNKIEDIITNTLTISGLAGGSDIWASATAYYINLAGERIESAYSNEVHATVPVEIDTNILASPAQLVIIIRGTGTTP